MHFTYTEAKFDTGGTRFYDKNNNIALGC